MQYKPEAFAEGWYGLIANKKPASWVEENQVMKSSGDGCFFAKDFFEKKVYVTELCTIADNMYWYNCTIKNSQSSKLYMHGNKLKAFSPALKGMSPWKWTNSQYWPKKQTISLSSWSSWSSFCTQWIQCLRKMKVVRNLLKAHFFPSKFVPIYHYLWKIGAIFLPDIIDFWWYSAKKKITERKVMNFPSLSNRCQYSGWLQSLSFLCKSISINSPGCKYSFCQLLTAEKSTKDRNQYLRLIYREFYSK